MRLRGRYYKDGKFWLAEIPLLDAMTQARTRRELFEMVADLVETLVDQPEFSVYVYPGTDGEFELSASDTQALLGLLLRRQRERSGLSLADVTERLGAKSRNAYARYERGTAMPSVMKLSELIQAVSPGGDLVLAESQAEYTTQPRDLSGQRARGDQRSVPRNAAECNGDRRSASFPDHPNSMEDVDNRDARVSLPRSRATHGALVSMWFPNHPGVVPCPVVPAFGCHFFSCPC